MIPPDLLRDLTASSSDLASCHSSTLGRLAAAANDATCSADHRKSVFLARGDVPMTGAAPDPCTFIAGDCQSRHGYRNTRTDVGDELANERRARPKKNPRAGWARAEGGSGRVADSPFRNDGPMAYGGASPISMMLRLADSSCRCGGAGSFEIEGRGAWHSGGSLHGGKAPNYTGMTACGRLPSGPSLRQGWIAARRARRPLHVACCLRAQCTLYLPHQPVFRREWWILTQ